MAAMTWAARKVGWVMLLASPCSAQLTAKRESAVTIEVLVVDRAGRPCPDVPVAFLRCPVAPEGFPEQVRRRLSSFAEVLDTVRTEAETGIARFEQVQRRIQPEEKSCYKFQLGRVTREPVEVLLATERLLSSRFQLVSPACGSVILHFPDDARGSVLLRNALEQEAQGPFQWSERDCQKPIHGGRALFRGVEIGLVLDYQIVDEKSAHTLSGRFQGPAEEGQEVEYLPPGLDSRPLLVGRILDDALAPVANLELNFCVCVRGSSRGHSITTGPDGRFRMSLLEDLPSNGARYVEISAAYWNEAAKQALGDAYAPVDLSAELEPTVHDLGDIVLFVPAGRYLAGLDGEELLKLYRDSMRFRSLNGRYQERVETCLLEMARRGTTEFQEFLASELARIRSDDDRRRTLLEADLDLEYLTALRRAQRKTDPLAIEVLEPGPIEITFPEEPVLECRIVNVDVEGESIFLTEGGSYRSGRFERMWVEGTGPDGRPLEGREWKRSFGGGMSQTRELKLGKSVGLVVPLSSYVVFPSPGVYSLRIHYHDQDDIARDGSVAGRIVTSTRPIRVVLRACVVKAQRQELEQLRRWLDEVDLNEEVLLVEQTWKPDLEFDGKPRSQADRIFRAGWKSVPILIETLEDEAADPRKRSFALAMLWNVTGLLCPEDTPFSPSPIGPYRWVGSWPSVRGAGSSMEARIEKSQRQFSEKLFARFAERWAEQKALFRVELSD